MEQATSALPAGWNEYTDPNSGKTFFHNTATNETTWTRPTAPAAAAPAAAAPPADGAAAGAAGVAGAADPSGGFQGGADATAAMGMGAPAAATAPGLDAAAMYAAAMGVAPGLGGYAAMAGTPGLGADGAAGLGAAGFGAAGYGAANLGAPAAGLGATNLGGWTPIGASVAAQNAAAGAGAAGGMGGMGGGGMNGGTFPSADIKSGTVKLWNEEKGFGFISPGEGGDDVFVHRSTLADGLSLLQGSTVSYEAAWNPQRNKFAVTRCTGAQAGKGATGGGKGAGGPPPNSAGPTVADGTTQSGTVKVWYDDKGFGFIVPEGGGEDVFVHRHALKDGQLLTQGTPVTFRIAWNDQKGKYLATECMGATPGQGPPQAMGKGGCCGGKGKFDGGAGYGKGNGMDMMGARPSPYGAGMAPMDGMVQNNMQAYPQTMPGMHGMPGMEQAPATDGYAQMGGYMGVA